MKRNNTAEKTILQAEQISKALKESTEKSLMDLMNEAISNIIKEDDEEVEDEEKDSEVNNEEDVDTVEIESADDEEPEVEDVEDETEGESEEDLEADAEDDADEWSDMEEFKVGDNDYDITSVDGETALKIYNKLGDDDMICVKKTDDETYEVTDEETGAEYVIELNADEETPETDDEAIAVDGDDDAEIEFDFGDDTEEDADDAEIEIEDEDGNAESEDEDDEDIELNEDENMMVNDYQKKTAMTLPADKDENDSIFDAGAPKGGENASRPYGKRGDDAPFEETVNECGDADVEPTLDENNISASAIRTTKKGFGKTGAAGNEKKQGEKNHSVDGAIRESAMKVLKKAKEIQEQNKLYEACIEKLKKSVFEAATLNVNMGKVINLLVTETTTAKEKQSILERFNNVKTIKEGDMLYESIKRELNESKKTVNVMTEKQISAKPTKTLNETTIYTNTSNPALDLMNRMDNLFK